jgi:hypothetical protein
MILTPVKHARIIFNQTNTNVYNLSFYKTQHTKKRQAHKKDAVTQAPKIFIA